MSLDPLILDSLEPRSKWAALVPLALLAASLGGLATASQAQDDKIKLHPEAPSPSDAGTVAVSQEQLSSGRVKIASVKKRKLDVKVVASGRVTFDDKKVAHVYSPATGRVVQIIADPGAMVKKGDPLAIIESPDLGSALSDMLKAKADLNAAEHDYRRQKELEKIHAAATRDLEQAQDNYERAKAEMERAELKSKMWHITKDDVVSQHFTLRSPIDGEVLMRNLNPGTEVQGMYASANIANELFTIGDLSSVWVVGDFYEADLARVKSGETVTIKSVAYPKETFQGSIAWVSNMIDPTLRTAKIRCQIDNPEKKLKPEMFVTMDIGVGSKEALAVPKQAVVRISGQAIVFVPVGDKASEGQQRFRPVPVQTGDEDDQFVEISEGNLTENQAVVVDGALLLSNML